jgi:hypothetical protein
MRGCLRTVYGCCIAAAGPEDLSVIERAGRRCAVCHTGRQWRRFEVVRSEGHDPVVVCGGCKPRYVEKPVVSEAKTPVASAPVVAAEAVPVAPPEDRLKRVLRELPAGEYSTERIAKAAGLNSAKVLARLHALKDAREVQQVGKQWSTVQPASNPDLEAAFDRLQASTGNLRIVRERERVS